MLMGVDTGAPLSLSSAQTLSLDTDSLLALAEKDPSLPMRKNLNEPLAHAIVIAIRKALVAKNLSADLLASFDAVFGKDDDRIYKNMTDITLLRDRYVKKNPALAAIQMPRCTMQFSHLLDASMTPETTREILSVK